MMAKTKRICSIDGCGKHAIKRGWCNAHYKRWWKRGDPLAVAPRAQRINAPCSVDGCSGLTGGPGAARGYCNKHYHVWHKYGDPLAGRYELGEQLAWLKSKAGHDGEECLAWPFRSDRGGYGSLRFEGKLTTASRVMCILAHGRPDNEKMDAAHLCHNGHLGCVNPRHIEWQTISENRSAPRRRRRTPRT